MSLHAFGIFAFSGFVKQTTLVSLVPSIQRARTPIEMLTGETPDISEYLDFGFYDRVVFKQNAGLGEAKLGRWLGVSHKVGQLMSYWILPVSGIPISFLLLSKGSPTL